MRMLEYEKNGKITDMPYTRGEQCKIYKIPLRCYSHVEKM
jgi:hypothetical protein